MLDAAATLADLSVPPGNRDWRNSWVSAQASTAFGSTINGAFASAGMRETLTMSRLPIITRRLEWL